MVLPQVHGGGQVASDDAGLNAALRCRQRPGAGQPQLDAQQKAGLQVQVNLQDAFPACQVSPARAHDSAVVQDMSMLLFSAVAA